jgi:tetratricopeptide (TPR) repeat protein
MTRSGVRLVLVAGLLPVAAGCATHTTPPVVPARPSPAVDYPRPDIPAGLTVAPDVRSQHLDAWQRLQAGDSRTASREFQAILKRNPTFYPAEAGLGFVQLAARQFKNANASFAAALAANDRYLPAWLGQSDAWLGLGRDAEAIDAMTHVLALDPRRDAVRTRLELVRFRLTQTLIEAGRRAAAAGHLDEAEQQFEQALGQSPQSTMILHELAAVETTARKYDEAEAHARKAVEIEPRDAEGQAALGAVLESRGKFREASVAYGRAAAIEPRPDWRTHSADLREKAELAALPADFADLPSAPSVSRAQVAAFIGIRLESLINAAPRRMTDVATDVRAHWAEPWILPVTRAGVMNIFPNHTFQPAATMRRVDLASVVAALVRLAGTSHPADMARWQAARPRFADLPVTHVSYPVVALAVASGAMAPDEAGRFAPTRLASGADLDAAVRRLTQLSTP